MSVSEEDSLTFEEMGIDLPDGYRITGTDKQGYVLEIEGIDYDINLLTENGLSPIASYLGFLVWGEEFDGSLAERYKAKEKLIEGEVLDENGELTIELPDDLKKLYDKGPEVVRGGFRVPGDYEVQVAEAVEETDEDFLATEDIADNTSLTNKQVGVVMGHWIKEYDLDEYEFYRRTTRTNYWLHMLTDSDHSNTEKSVVEDVLEDNH